MAFNPDEWQLIKFSGTETPASLGLPSGICNMTTPLPIAPALFLAKRANPQRFYWINTMSRIPAGVSQAVSEGHSPNEFPQGYGGASCDGTPWPPVDPPPAPLPANYTLMSGKAISGQDIKGFSSFSDCQAACDADPNCAGFTVMAGSRTGTTGRWCGLKSSTTTMGPNATFDTFTKNPVVTTPVVTVASQPTTLASAQLPAADTTIQTTQLPAATTTTTQTLATAASKSGLPKWSYWAMGGGAVLLLLIVIGVASRKPKKAAAPI
jgi:hypothetical protein